MFNPILRTQRPVNERSSRSDQFRHDVNFIRALAVTLVLFFHLEAPGFDNGFLGVDMFFVVSGFLMTGILMRKLSVLPAGSGVRDMVWLLWDFWAARIRRIFPALVVMVAAVAVAGYFLLPLTEYYYYCSDAIAALFFASNAKFYASSGYFDDASHERILLHTWSLGVEWQFYLVFPLILIGLRFARVKRPSLTAFSLLAVVSLGWNVKVAVFDPSAAFYLLPSRCWEFLAGGIAYFVARGNKSWFVLGVIFVALALALPLVNEWPLPGALCAVVGTCLILAAGVDFQIFRNRAVVIVGKSSYSIYLWHWPLIVIGRYYYLDAGGWWPFVAVVCSVGLGLVSYWLIESLPARISLLRRRVLGPLTVAAGAALACIPLGYVYAEHGLEGRMTTAIDLASLEKFNRSDRRDECHSTGGRRFPWCVAGTGPVRAVVVGDSHANAVVSAVVEATRGNGSVAFASYTLCPTVEGAVMSSKRLKCAEFNSNVLRRLQGLPSTVPVLVVNRLSHYYSNNPSVPGLKEEPNPVAMTPAEFRRSFVDTMCKLSRKRRVVIAKPIPEMHEDVPRALARKLASGKHADVGISDLEYGVRHRAALQLLDDVAAECGIALVETRNVFCSTGTCIGQLDGRPLYYDDNHLSEYGNRRLTEELEHKLFSPIE